MITKNTGVSRDLTHSNSTLCPSKVKYVYAFTHALSIKEHLTFTVLYFRLSTIKHTHPFLFIHIYVCISLYIIYPKKISCVYFTGEAGRVFFGTLRSHFNIVYVYGAIFPINGVFVGSGNHYRPTKRRAFSR